MSFQFCEGHLDRIEVRAVGREEKEPSAPFSEDGAGSFALVAGKIIEDHDIARLECWGELGFNICLEDRAVHGPVDYPWRGQMVVPQASNERLCHPVSKGGVGLEAMAAARPSAQAGHLGRCSGLVDEDEPVRLTTHARQPMLSPLLTSVANVGAFGLGCQ